MLVIRIFSLILFHSIHIFSLPYRTECNEKLLEDRVKIPDSSFSQSSYEDNFQGKFLRESYGDDQAWCPKGEVRSALKEYVEIDMGRLCVVKMMMTRGRNAVGYVSAHSYFIKYKLENSSDWKSYVNYSDSKELIGRKDPLNEKFISLEPPLVARWIRIFPYQSSNEKVCLKLQLYGCTDTNHVVEYRMMDGSSFEIPSGTAINIRRFKDRTYNGQLLENNTLIGGVGKLTDDDIEKGNTESPVSEKAKKFVGWNRNQLNEMDHVTITFRFDTPRNFSWVFLRAANHFDYNIRIFKIIELQAAFTDSKMIRQRKTEKRKEVLESDDRIRTNRWIEIDIRGLIGNAIIMKLYFASRWIILSEVHFVSNYYLLPKDIPFQNPITSNPGTTKVTQWYPDDSDSEVTNKKSIPLAMILGILCGGLALVILVGCLLIIYTHNRRIRNSPMKERVLQLKYSDNNEFFLPHDPEHYSTTAHLSKGTFIPFNISPHHKPYSPPNSQQQQQQQQQHHQSTTILPQNNVTLNHKSLSNHHTPTKVATPFLTPNHHLVSLTSTPVIIKQHQMPQNSSPASRHYNNRSLDNCIYTSLPASDTDSNDTLERSNQFQNPPYQRRFPQLDHNINNNNNNNSSSNMNNINISNSNNNNNNLQQMPNTTSIIAPLFQNPNFTSYLTNRSMPFDKLYCNNATVDIDSKDDINLTFQCHPEFMTGFGMIYSNRRQSQDYDSFKTQTWNDSEDDMGSFTNPVGLAEYEVFEISGCCGNSTYGSVNKGANAEYNDSVGINAAEVANTNRLLSMTSFYYSQSDTSTLPIFGRGIFGQIRIDNSPTNTLSNVMTAAENGVVVSPAICSNPVIIKVLNERCPTEAKERFLKEVSIMSSLTHSGICQIISIQKFNLSDNKPGNDQYILSCAIEYSSYGDLYSYFQNLADNSPIGVFNTIIGRGKFPSISQTLITKLLLQLSEALQYISKKQLIHRDVSCRNCIVYNSSSASGTGSISINGGSSSINNSTSCNIVGGGNRTLAPASNDITIKLSDTAMSQSRYYSYYHRPNTLSLVANINVTNSYLCPFSIPLRWSPVEVIVGTNYSEKSDVYAFGVTAWEMFTKCRSLPFSELSNEQLVAFLSSFALQQHNHSDYHVTLPVLPLPSNCAKEMGDLITQCIQTQSVLRPTFDDIAVFLQNKLSQCM